MSEFPRKILVTGAAGFLGSNLVEKLLDAGHEKVVGIDNLSMGSKDNLSGFSGDSRFQLLERDIVDEKSFDDLDTEFDCIVHLAAFKIPRYGKAIDTLKINAKGSEHVLDFGRKCNCKCVLASTSDVYGRNPDLPFSEEHNAVIGSSKVPRWAYAVSKLYDEHMALAYQDAYGFPVTLLRFFGSYGPNMHLSWWGGPPPVFIEAVLKDEEIPIHGDGSQTRSFTYVSDTVAGIYASIVKPEANGEILNVGGDEEVTILDLAKAVKRASGLPGEPRIKFIPYESFSTGKKYEDVMRRVPDTRLCERILGVKAQVSLDEGLRRTIEWQRRVMGL